MILQNYDAIFSRGLLVAASANRHVHRSVCRYGPSGRTGCRMSMGQMTRRLPTGIFQLKTTKSPLYTWRKWLMVHTSFRTSRCSTTLFFLLTLKKPAKPPVSVGDFFGNPLHLVDNKVVRVWELYRPSLKDAAVVAFSPTLSAMVQCNTAVYLLGSAIWLYGQIHGQRQTWN